MQIFSDFAQQITFATAWEPCVINRLWPCIECIKALPWFMSMFTLSHVDNFRENYHNNTDHLAAKKNESFRNVYRENNRNYCNEKTRTILKCRSQVLSFCVQVVVLLAKSRIFQGNKLTYVGRKKHVILLKFDREKHYWLIPYFKVIYLFEYVE